MKAAILLALFCCVAAAVGKECQSNSDCNSDECCLRRNIHPARCLKLRQEGEYCVLEDEGKEESEYRHMCPCAEGLTCGRKANNRQYSPFITVSICRKIT
ncbi:U3-aranetoxin-Ce1a, partial [Stegodyphus mimosarum]